MSAPTSAASSPAIPRITRRFALSLACGLGLGPAASRAGTFDPQVGQPGEKDAIPAATAFAEYASTVVSLQRGPQDIANPNGPLASSGSPSSVVGQGPGGTFGVLSLGDGGSITLGFNTPIANGAGADFAVFENGFLSGGPGLAFLELAFVDVSSDGVHFFRFPSVSQTQTATQVGGFGLLDASNLHDLAGKYVAGYGTGFDLSELAGVSPLLNVNHITEVKITDVVGSIDPRYGSKDSLGHSINDPYSTPFASSGFDLGGVGVIHTAVSATAVPEPASLSLALAAGGILATAVARRRRRPGSEG